MNPASAIQAYKPISLVLIERKSFVLGLRARTYNRMDLFARATTSAAELRAVFAKLNLFQE